MTYDHSNRGVHARKPHAMACKKCEKDTPHRDGACMYCGTLGSVDSRYPVMRARRGAYLASVRRLGRIEASYRDSIRNNTINQDRRAAFARQAEESRARFESKK